MSPRVGFGFDLHRLVRGRPLILGGLTIPSAKGLLGHSDADVVLHALASALLGAIGAGDLGTHFSDRDPRWKGVSSRRIVEQVMRMVGRRGGIVENADITIVAEAPRLEPYKSRMAVTMAHVLKVSTGQVNVKATTAEGLGPIGRGQAMAAYAVVALTLRPRRQKRRS